MKRLLTLVMALSMAVAFSGIAAAGTWETKCAACHKDGNKMKAPTTEQMLEKHKSADSFVKAAMESKNPMMKAFQKEDVLNDAAKELYTPK